MMVGLRWLSLVALLAFLVSTGEVLGKSIQGKPNKQTGGKVRSTSNAKAKHKEKALYGKIYEETKHDVNRAIEDAILEASQKATDMVLQPKVTSKLVDNMASKIQAEVAGSGEGEGGNAIDEMAQSYTSAVSEKLTGKSSADHKKKDHKKASKKHHTAKAKHDKHKAAPKKDTAKASESTSKAAEDIGKAAEEIAKAAESDGSEPVVENITVSGVDDEEAEAAAKADNTPSDEPPVEAKDKTDEESAEDNENKDVKPAEAEKAKEEKKEGGEVLLDNGLEASGMDMDMDDIDTTKSQAKVDNASGAEAGEEMEEKSDLVPSDDAKEPDTRDSGPTAAAAAPPPKPVEADVAAVAMAAKQIAQEGGQEDLKALLDESINNLVRANSAVEVLLKATNPSTAAAIQAQQMPPMQMQPQPPQQQQQQQQQQPLQQQLQQQPPLMRRHHLG